MRSGDQHGFFQNITAVQLEETNKLESQCVRDEGGRLLRDKIRIRERWVRFIRSLLKAKSDMLDLDVPESLPQRGMESTEEETATAMKAMTNAKTGGPDGLLAKLLKLGLQQDRTILLELRRHSPPSLGARGKSHSSGKTRSLPYSTRRATRPYGGNAVTSCSCRTRVRFFLKWLPGDSALTVRRRDFYRRSSAAFDRIARPRE